MCTNYHYTYGSMYAVLGGNSEATDRNTYVQVWELINQLATKMKRLVSC